MTTKNCRQCHTQHHRLISTEGEVRRIARMMAKMSNTKRLSVYKDQLAIAKMQQAEARSNMAEDHECDTLLSDEHWTKKRA